MSYILKEIQALNACQITNYAFLPPTEQARTSGSQGDLWNIQ